jgi:hypothetical protein
MNGQENPVELLVMCAIVVVLSILGLVAGVSRDLLGNMDGILMMGVCLMMALIFAILLLVLLKQQGWLGKHKPESSSEASSTKAK